MSSERRKATEMVRVTKWVRAALTLMRTEESVRQGKRVTDSDLIYELLKRYAPEYLQRAKDMLPLGEADTEDAEDGEG